MPFQPAPPPANEAERLAEVRALNILDTPCEERFDRITRLTTEIFRVPIAYVAVIDAHRQWFKSKQGIEICETPRSVSFCAFTILQSEALVIPDTTLDPRFSESLIVTGPPHIRFYAGHPVRGPKGYPVATICMVDTRPHDFSASDRAILKELAKLVEHELRMVDIIKLQREHLATRERLDRELAEAAAYIESLLPPPTSEPPMIDWRFVPASTLGGDGLGYHRLDDHRTAFYLLDVTGHSVGSALLATSIINLLRAETLPEVDFGKPAQVLLALNNAFPMEAHDEKYFSLWYGVYDETARKLSYSSAGHPPALLMTGEDAAGREMHPLGAGGLPVGMMRESDYEWSEKEIPPGARLYVFSDGAFEIPRPDADRWTFEEFAEHLRKSSTGLPDELDTLIAHLRNLQNTETFTDDVSILRVRF